MPLILGAQSAVGTGDLVTNSCRFNNGDSPYFSSDFTGTGSSSAAIATYSFWIKLALEDTRATLISGKDDTSNYMKVRLADDGAGWYFAIYGISPACDLRSAKILRDPSAWYHVVMAFDTGQAVDTDRIKVWINGGQITIWDTATYLAQNDELFLTKCDDLEIGSYNNTEHFDGYMAEVVCIDGTAYDADDFGEYDSDSPNIWKPKDVSGLTFGTKGYYLNFKDSAALGDDASGNNNDFTENNIAAIDQCTDTPQNNFCTMNNLGYSSTGFTIQEGNTYISAVADTASYTIYGTMAVLTGKWYWEAKAVTVDSASYRHSHGIGDVAYAVQASAGEAGDETNAWTYGNAGGYKTGGSGGQESSDYLSYATGDILSFALDCDNAKLYLRKNGTWQKSGDPTSGATGTGAISITANVTYAPAFVMRYAANQVAANFGNPSYTNPSDDEADANDYGRFAYSVPSGYLALCTKNLGSDGG